MSSIDFKIAIDDELYSKYQDEYIAGNYTGAIKTAILYLTECIRERTDLDLDGDKLISQAFSVSSPYIRLNELKTETEKNEQIGTMMMLQGVYKAIRNPRNHDLKVDNRFTCDSIIILINYFIYLVKNGKLIFDYNDFYDLVIDIHFDRSIEYSDELVKSIPQDKLLDVNIRLIESITESNFRNISYLIYSSIKLLNEYDKSDLLKFCSSILSKTTDYTIIQALVFALRDDWKNLEKSVCLRIENILIEALKKIEYEHFVEQNGFFQKVHIIPNKEVALASYIKYIPRPFTKDYSNVTIYSIIKEKLMEGNDYLEFIFKHLNNFLFSAEGHLFSTFNDQIIQLLKSENKFVYEKLTSGQVFDDDFEPNYTYDEVVLKHIKKFS